MSPFREIKFTLKVLKLVMTLKFSKVCYPDIAKEVRQRFLEHLIDWNDFFITNVGKTLVLELILIKILLL